MPLLLQPHILAVPGTGPAGRGKPSQSSPRKGSEGLAHMEAASGSWRGRALQGLKLAGRGGWCFSDKLQDGPGGCPLCVHAQSLQSCPTLCDTMDSSLAMGFSRQEYWSGLPCPPPEDLPDPGIEPASLVSPALAGSFFTTRATWKPFNISLLWFFALQSSNSP